MVLSSSSAAQNQMATQGQQFLEIKDLTRTFIGGDGSETVVLDGVNLAIAQREFVAIIGHSGCGKSTLLRIVAGLDKATSGSVQLEGKEIRKPGADRMMVFQQYSLLPWLTVEENVRLAIDEVMPKMTSLQKKQIVSEHLQMVNLIEAAKKYPDEISGGMKQRVGIARALATRPKTLLMDEPFGALDALTKQKLQTQVLEIWEGQPQAVMMITHDIDEALYMADRIVMITNGPKAKIGEILTVPFSHPRDRHHIRETHEYYELRNHALDFLEAYFS
jgi:nitrate/nitrite transport system ATP-binding protein